MNFIQKFTKRDFGFAVLTGAITGTIAWRVFLYLGVPEFQGIPWESLIVIIPICWILGVLLGYFLGQWMGFFNQFGKFATIGFTNFAVNAAVLNILLAQTGYVKGNGYSVIASISFLVAMISSYIWNRYWAFRSQNTQVAGEFAKFFIVNILAFGVNVLIASLIVNGVSPLMGLDAPQWANIGTVMGSAVALVFSFVGFRLAVFRR